MHWKERSTILRINNLSIFHASVLTMVYVVGGGYAASVRYAAGDWLTPFAFAVFGICIAAMLAGQFGLWRRIRDALPPRKPRVLQPMSEAMREHLRRDFGIENPDSWQRALETAQRFEGRGFLVAVAQDDGIAVLARGPKEHEVRATADRTGRKYFLIKPDPEYLLTPFSPAVLRRGDKDE